MLDLNKNTGVVSTGADYASEYYDYGGYPQPISQSGLGWSPSRFDQSSSYAGEMLCRNGFKSFTLLALMCLCDYSTVVIFLKFCSKSWRELPFICILYLLVSVFLELNCIFWLPSCLVLCGCYFFKSSEFYDTEKESELIWFIPKAILVVSPGLWASPLKKRKIWSQCWCMN